MQFPHLRILAFEKREEGAALMDGNMRKSGTPGIDFFTGDFTEMNIDSLPCPDAVFIGGHGGKMKEIVTKIKSVLNSKAAIVFNAVSDDSRQMFIDALLENNLVLMQDIEIKIDDFNTIHVMKGSDNI
jgi:precorrin-6Y C5,15-methyltransferase (decarboxylating)